MWRCKGHRNGDWEATAIKGYYIRRMKEATNHPKTKRDPRPKNSNYIKARVKASLLWIEEHFFRLAECTANKMPRCGTFPI
jgi:hypothetical protein